MFCVLTFSNLGMKRIFQVRPTSSSFVAANWNSSFYSSNYLKVRRWSDLFFQTRVFNRSQSRIVCVPWNYFVLCSCIILGAFAKLRKVDVSFIMYFRLSLRQRGTTRLPLDGVCWNMMFAYFSKLCLENWSFIEIWQELTGAIRENIRTFMIYCSNLRRMRNVSGRSFRVNENTHFVFNNFSENRAFVR